MAALNSEECHGSVKAILCQHCGVVVPVHRRDRFCCAGCSAVYQFIVSAHLGDYYQIRDQAGVFRQPSPVLRLSEKLELAHPFLYLDDPVFREELGIPLLSPKVQFYLEGVYCTACLWLIEKLPELLPNDVSTARLDLQSSVVDFAIKAGGSISAVADYLDHLGYRPHPIFSSEQKKELAKKESRSFLAKVALAGALTGNIMIFAVSIYAGATGFLKDNFDWIILLLAMPVFTYCAMPLYQNAWSAIKNKRWSVDIPIVVALAAGFITSIYSICTKGSQNYLDSLCGLIFLLLGSRYFLMRLQKNAFEGMQFSESFYPVKILRNENEYVWVKELKIGDLIEIPAGLRIPVDGVVVRGQSHVNDSIISGESLPRPVMEHEAVFAGSLNSDSTLWVRVNAVGDETRIGKIAREIQKFEINRNETVKLAEKVAKWFTLLVLSWSLAVFVYFTLAKNAPAEGIQRVLALLIVSCPCAFAIATPLALIQAFQKLIKRGVYLRDPNDIEKVLSVKKVAFDKTGTLTEGVLEVQEFGWRSMISTDAEIENLLVIRALEQDSKHPIARALLRYIDSRLADATLNGFSISDEVSNLTEVSGQGVSGNWRNQKIEVKAATQSGDLIQSAFLCDGVELAFFSFKDRVKVDTKSVIDSFHARGISLWMLSGDHEASAKSVADTLGFQKDQVLFDRSPESKAKWIESHPGTLYVGDGANDGLALNKAALGIAAHGALDVSMKAASIYLTQNSLRGVVDLFTVSEETKKILKRHLIFTVLYNGSTISLASMGMLRPLISAVLMPLSSLIILISTQVGTKKLRILK